jgi:hypothetical protein
MSAAYYSGYQQAPQESGWGSGGTAIAALVIAIIAIIFIIIIVFLFVRGSPVLTSGIVDWLVVPGAGPTSDQYTGQPNSIFVTQSSGPAGGYTVNVTPYSTISSYVFSSKTTIFKISATSSPVDVIVGPSTAFIAPGPGAPDPLLVKKGETATYMWVSTTQAQRIE